MLSIFLVCTGEAGEPLVRTVDLSIDEAATVELHDGSKARIKLIGIDSRHDPIRSAVRESMATVEVNGERAELVCSTYRLPVEVGGVQVDCPITRAYLENSGGNAWALEADARFRLWPSDSPWVKPETFAYPVRQKWFASATQMANEPVYVNGGERPGDRSIYYHYGLDFGGAEDMVDVVAATDARVVSVGGEVLEGHEDSPVSPRYDVIYLLDDRNWYYRYSHLKLFETDVDIGDRVGMGQKLGELGKEGGSGGWSHLHFHVEAKQPSGNWGILASYPFVWRAYLREHDPKVIAVARPHQLARVGETVTLDASRSWAKDGEIERYLWRFGDGSKVEGAQVQRSYSEPGRYCEVLEVVDESGCIDYDFAVVEVHGKEHPDRVPPTIHAAYSPTSGIQPGDPVTFKVRSFRVAEGGETWDFGDGSDPVTVTSDGNARVHADEGYATTVHRFAEAGDYIVSVRCRNRHGQPAVDRLHVRVRETSER